MQSLKNLFKKSFTSTFIGDLIEQRSIAQWYQSKYESIPSLEEAINSINNRWSITLQDDKEQPIFIFSAGWRSGSTLLQRIVNSDSDTLIWGEPFAESNFIQKLANSIQVFREKEPAEYYFLKSLKNKDSLAGRWTANLYPNINYLFQSHRNFFLTLYAQSAREYGFTRWGFKEVRLTLDHAVYLKWLFPNAKFLFLYRDPYKCYQSCYTWRNLYWTWPNEPVIGPEEFGRHWLEQVIQFTRDFEKVNGYLIRPSA